MKNLHTFEEFLNEAVKYDTLDYSYGKENREEGRWRFFLNDGNYPMDKKAILKKYPKNAELIDCMTEVENERDSLNGTGGIFYVNDTKCWTREKDIK